MPNEIANRIREEHEKLHGHLNAFREVLYAEEDDAAREEKLREMLGWLKEDLLPHAKAEESHLYSEVDRLAGSRGAQATSTMLMDHASIQRLVEQLEEILADPTLHGDRHADWVQMIGAQLEITLTMHFEKEEEVYLRLLDSL